MVGKNLTMVKKTQIVTMYKDGKSMTQIAKEMGVSKNTVSIWCNRAKDGNIETVLKRKEGAGRPKKTSPETDRLLRRAIMKQPSLTSKDLKDAFPNLLAGVSQRTIQHRLRKDLGLPSFTASKKPLLTDRMRKKRMDFCKKYASWTEEQWQNVVFSDEACLYLIPSVSKKVRRPRGSNRFAEKYTVKTVKHSPYVMVWGCFSGAGGRGGLYFLPKSTTMNGERYCEVLKDHLMPFKEILRMEVFMHDGAPCHKGLKTRKFLADNHVEVLDWPGNSPDLNPIENAWSYMKRHLRGLQEITSIAKLMDAIKKVWLMELDKDYFKCLASSMPKRINYVLKHKGAMSKY